VTTSTGREVEKRRGPPRKPKTLAEDLAAELRRDTEGWAAKVEPFTWAKYRDDPIGFFREVLGVEPWAKQRQMIELVRDHPRVAVSSGHKVSKSHTLAGIALWFYSCFEDARVIFTSTTSRQVDRILWLELRMMTYRSGRCVDCKREDPHGVRIPRPCPHSAIIVGKPADLARSGLRSKDPAQGFREVVGFTAREAEAVAGISGKNLLYLADEASGIGDPIFQAMEGNRAGGARIVLTSNPTRNEGEFYEAFHGKSEFFRTMRISSEESPNVIAGTDVIPGLCQRSYIEEKRQEWGEDSSEYKIRIKGEFALGESLKVISLHDLLEAERRWEDTEAEGRLFIGIDPAGEGKDGDESVFAVRRGLKVIGLYAVRGMTTDALLMQLLGIISEHRKPREEPPVVILDSEGSIGARVAGTLRSHTDRNPDAFVLVPVKASHWATREPENYERIRDELWANLRDWIKHEGGAVPEDRNLHRELHAPEWHRLANGKSKVTPKRELKKVLGRSPDRADAVALCVWRPRSLDGISGDSRQEAEVADPEATPLDPYAGLSAWRSR
jgi:hypothetical protein